MAEAKEKGALGWWRRVGRLLRLNLEARSAGAAHRWRLTRTRLSAAAEEWGRIIGGRNSGAAARMMSEYLSALVDLSRCSIHPGRASEEALTTLIRHAKEFGAAAADTVADVAEGFPAETFRALMAEHTAAFIDLLCSFAEGDKKGYEKADAARMAAVDRMGLISSEWMMGVPA